MSHLDKTGNSPASPCELDQARLRSLARVFNVPAAPAPGDGDALRNQLGRVPDGLWLVVRRDPLHRPVVLATYPLVQDRQTGFRPFPNLLWLTDVNLSRAVSDLERVGWLTRLQTEINDNLHLSQQLAQHHAQYAQMRWDALIPEDQQLVKERGWESELAQRGIGGLSPEGTRLKCLHAHVAQELVTGNALGRRVLELIHSSDTRQ